MPRDLSRRVPRQARHVRRMRYWRRRWRPL